MSIQINTERLVLKKIKLKDINLLIKNLNNWNITKWLINISISRNIPIKPIVPKFIIENFYWKIEDKLTILEKICLGCRLN